MVKRKNPLLCFFSVLFFSIITLIILLFIFIIVKAKLHPNDIPDIFGYKPLIVMSGSMETKIYKGDLVIVKEVDPLSLKKNDIIAFRNSDNTVTTHRIKRITEINNKSAFITRGDNNNTDDEGYVYPEKVEGKYMLRIKNMGYVLMFIKKPLGLIICLSVILMGGTIYILLKNQSANKLSKEELEELKKFREKQKNNQL